MRRALIVLVLLTPLAQGQDKQLAEEVQALRKEVQELIKVTQAREKALAALQAELDRRRTENEDLRRLSEARDKMILKLEHDNAALKKEATQRRFEAEAMQARMEQLLKQVHELQIVVARAKVDAPPPLGKGAPRPPDALIKGSIVKVDESGLIMIDIGSDHGLKVNKTLEVFRLRPEPLHLGQIVVIDVMPNRAVARMAPSARRTELKVGDQVSSGLTK